MMGSMAAASSSCYNIPPEQQLQLELVPAAEEDRQEWKKILPIGFRFKPTDQELLHCYLRAKVSGWYIAPGIFAELNVYMHEPHNLHKFAYKNGDERMYFFSPVKRKDSSRSKNERTVLDKGFWKASTAKQAIKSLGYRASFVYFSFENINKTKSKKKLNWIMQEYRLPDPDDQPGDQLEECVTTLCVIYQRM